jgi:hypothetical protein
MGILLAPMGHWFHSSEKATYDLNMHTFWFVAWEKFDFFQLVEMKTFQECCNEANVLKTNRQ